MESVIVTTPRVSCDSGCYQTKSYVKPVKEVIATYPIQYQQVQALPVHPVKDHSSPPDCCNPMEIDVPLKRTCVYLSQTPVLLFIIILTIIYIISSMFCWNACNCNNNNHCKKHPKPPPPQGTDNHHCHNGGNNNHNCEENECVSSTQRWTAFAVNTIIYVLLVVLISMWIYRLSQYKQTTGVAIAVAIVLPIFIGFFFGAINRLAMGTQGMWC